MIFSLLAFRTFDFAVQLIGALVMFAAGLLFWDAAQLNKRKNTVRMRAAGFFILAGVYVFRASLLQEPGLGLISQIFQTLGLTLILSSLLKEPVLNKPGAKAQAILAGAGATLSSKTLLMLEAILFLGIGLRYWQRAVKGLDKQLKAIALAFGGLTLAALWRMGVQLRPQDNVFWEKLVEAQAPLTNIMLGLELVSLLILGRWVWGYIRFRLRIQLFATILTSILGVFLATTVLFSYFLLHNLENTALSHLVTDAKVFQYSLNRLQLESLAHAKAIAADTATQEALLAKDQETLYQLTAKALVEQQLASLLITDSEGNVIMRAENRDSTGDSLASDPLVRSALAGQPLGTVTQNEKPLVPEILIKSAVPVRLATGTEVVGVVATGFAVDNALLDGVKAVTGLDVSVFAGNKRAATTILAEDGASRYVGTAETEKKVTDTVLTQKGIYLGQGTVMNEPYYLTYLPLLTLNDLPIGMLFVGKPQVELLELAERSINLTFLGSIAMLLAAVLPAYLLAKYIEKNIQA